MRKHLTTCVCGGGAKIRLGNEGIDNYYTSTEAAGDGMRASVQTNPTLQNSKSYLDFEVSCEFSLVVLYQAPIFNYTSHSARCLGTSRSTCKQSPT